MNENPIPLLLVLPQNSFGVNILDVDLQIDFNPTAIQTNRTIAKLNDTAHELCFDWIHRKLYWVQKCTTGICIIKQLDLTLWEQIGIVKYDKINISKKPIYVRFYMYCHHQFGSSEVMRSDLDGKNMKNLREDNKCFCNELHLESYSTLQTDTTNIEPLLYWSSVSDFVITNLDGLLNKTIHNINVSLPEPILNDGCKKYNLPTTIYNISKSYLTCLDNGSIKFEQFNVTTYERHYEFKNLMPFTEYTLKLALSNFYVRKLSMDLQFGSNVKVITTGKLDMPEDVTVQVLTPTLAIVYWMPSKKLTAA
ncbi:uncharacterized protein LOC114935066 [Nylanderia fulva]|uniref:uncharacterized protein LOC114935066 n=1 Tax=Nylanderia fulva TaxID=613905 RepID=UPI0010FAEBED|nr:uncharacterized protein LOC114935066 [Nylanderia fulva]